MGESMKKGASHTKVKVLFKDYIVHMAIFHGFRMHFSHNFSNWISNLSPNMTYNIAKTLFFFASSLTLYSQIYNFTFNHNYKFKTIIVLKYVWVSKSKRIYVFLFFELSKHMDPFLWNILKLKKNLKWFGKHLIRKNDFWNKKTTCPHVFL